MLYETTAYPHADIADPVCGRVFATNALRRLRADSTLPQISCGDDVLYLSVEDGRDAMLQGMNAWDGKDGDLTGDIVVERVSGGEKRGSSR